MTIYLYFKSNHYKELIPQIRLTCSKNGITGTAVLAANLEDTSILTNPTDPICGIGLQQTNSIRMADICHFVWASGKPIKIVAVFLFSNIYEKQDFFNYYPYYALSKQLEFFPANTEEINSNT